MAETIELTPAEQKAAELTKVLKSIHAGLIEAISCYDHPEKRADTLESLRKLAIAAEFMVDVGIDQSKRLRFFIAKYQNSQDPTLWEKRNIACHARPTRAELAKRFGIELRSIEDPNNNLIILDMHQSMEYIP